MSMVPTQSTGAALNSLPCEALALIASQLEPPDRQSLAQSCSSGQHAVIISTCGLTLPGSQVLAGLHHGDRHCCDGACCSTANCACSCSMGTSSFTPAAAALHKDGCTSTTSSSSSSDVSVLHTACSAESLEQLDPSSWLQRYTGVQSLTVTSCDSCQVPRTPRAVICSHSPRSPGTPADRDCSGPCGPGLASFLAAAGSSMPYLHKLDLSCACSCLAAPPSEVLATIATSCPRLTALSLPSWLLRIPAAGIRQHSSRKSFSSRTARKARTPTGGLAAPELHPISSGSSSSSDDESSGDRQLLPYQHPTDPQDAYGSPVCACGASASHLPLRKQLPQQQQWLQEHLSMLAPLCHLTSLSLVGSAPPPAAFAELSVLTRLHSFSLQVTESCLRWPSPLSSVPTWPGGLPDSNNHSNSSSNSHSSGKHSYSSGTVLGNSLAKLTALTSLALSGTEHASDTLKALSGMPQLAKVEICSLSDFSVSSLASLSGLTGLTHLRVHGCSALQSTARSALPLQLQCLQEMCVLDFDFDLHLRDLQVLCLLKRLSHLTATSFHHCIHLMPSLELPSLRCLHISHVSRLALQQQPQQQQQQGAPVAVQVVQALAGQPLGGPAAAAAAGPPVGLGNLAAAVAAGGVPVVPLSALPVFVNLQHQQQQEEHAQYLLVGPQGHPALLRQQQPPSAGAGAGTPISIQQHAGHLPLHAPGYGPQAVTSVGAAAAGVAALQQQQQPVLPNGISLQLLQLRQQQLYLQQQQLRLQEQQVQLQLQQMQAQLLQQGQQPHQHAAFNGAAADIVGAQQQQQQQPQPLAALIMQQGPAGPPAAPAAANGAVPCVQHKGWLAVLFPGLEELQLASAREFPPALPALQGHQSLQKLVIGTYRPVQQQQQQSVQGGKVVAFPQAGILAGMVTGGTGSRVFGLQGAAAASGGCVGAHWGMLRTLPCLEELVIHEAGAVLGSTPWVLGAAVSGQLCRLVLNDAAGLADLAAAALLGAYSWKRLEQLEIEGAKGLTHRGLNCLTGLPALKHLALSHCSGITASGLASLLLSSGSMKQLDLLCCAGVKLSEAQAVQDAVWAVSKRRVVVTWRCHDCRQS